MKKLLSLFGAAVLAASAAAALGTTIQSTTRVQLNSQDGVIPPANLLDEDALNLDWEGIGDSINNRFDALNQEIKIQNFSNNQSDAEMQVKAQSLEQAKAVSLDYLERFKNENLSLEQIIDILKTEVPEFEKNYKVDSDVDSDVSSQVGLSSFANIEVFAQMSQQQLNKLVKDLRISRATFTTISAAAAVVAAGFWAISWMIWPIGWATGASVASAVAGGVSAGLNIALIKYDNELSKWAKAGKALGSIYTLGHIFYNVLKPILITSASAAAGTSWAFPAIMTIVPIVGVILAWIEVFR